jgi:AraC family transcriptional regulator of adaptative response / DNA-3-methyladenine glycosylase II
VSVRLPHRAPLAADTLFSFLALRAVPGVESFDDGAYRRTLALPNGGGAVTLRPADGHIACTLRLDDLRDLAPAVARVRRLLDLDADPAAVDEQLGADPVLGPYVRRRPGVRVPGCVDGAEQAVRAVLGQQVSVAGARTLAGRLVAAAGEPLAAPDGELTHRFPTPTALLELGDADLPMPAARRRALLELCTALASGDIDLGPGADRDETAAALRRVPGIGPWTADYLAMRALGDPDAYLPSDLGVRRGLESAGMPGDPRSAESLAERWRPWRAYAVIHLWHSTPDKETGS